MSIPRQSTQSLATQAEIPVTYVFARYYGKNPQTFLLFIGTVVKIFNEELELHESFQPAKRLSTWYRQEDRFSNRGVSGIIMKLRERIIIFFGVTFALLTLLLVVDLQYDFGYSGPHLIFPTRHARVEVVETGGGFQTRFGTDGTPAGEASAVENAPVKPFDQPPKQHDSFEDLEMFAFPVDGTSSEFLKSSVVIVVFEERDRQPILADLLADMGSEEGYVYAMHHDLIILTVNSMHRVSEYMNMTALLAFFK